ncbi:hypothetical protein QBC42DRAFT_313635 [Cladorrhinum samala]|uniref:F-box domain-containing protein n=1 Tax=Cladorrhinum samala TaxID=585594 RepID=A0AAV9I097_9PEZI|nr:hypothetical protein QBC42DRAFT_313635 [Cladorrhinum samala]
MDHLSGLPAELLEEIVAGFCMACTPIERRCCYDPNFCDCIRKHPNDLTRISALVSLCLTSRRLNGIATRHLYHYVHGPRWWLLVRTLLARADLAQLIRNMRLSEYNRSVNRDDCPAEVMAYYQSQAEIYLDTLPESDRGDARGLDERTLCDGKINVQLEILLSGLCPNLETLEAVISWGAAFRFCVPGSMPHLRRLVLSHGDTEGGFELKTMAPLFRAAPNLASAVFFMAYHSCEEEELCEGLGATLPKLTSLDMHSGILDNAGLKELLSACPSLEDFRYEMCNRGLSYSDTSHFAIAESQGVFLTCAPNLRSLSLEVGINDMWEDGQWDRGELDELGRVMAERGVRFVFKSDDPEDGIEDAIREDD